jgi:hypothetical protein
MNGEAPRVTRRTLLGGVAIAGAGIMLGPAANAAAAQGQGRAVFGRWVGRLHGESGPLMAPRRFVLAGLQWSGPSAARIELRTRTASGSWGRWTLASITGHEGDGVTVADGIFGEPVWTGAADLVQLRSAKAVQGLRVHFVAARGLASADGSAIAGDVTSAGPSALAAALPLAQPVLAAGPGQPPIIARSAWADGHAPPQGSAFYGDVEMAVIHHTDNGNGYGPGQVPAMLRAIFDFHRYVRGWFDIGYNFVIDAFGRIWEARAGGIDEPVIGAHAGDFNPYSTGVAVLGTFNSVVPSQAAIGALERLVAWKLALHGTPSTGKVRLHVDRQYAYFTRFRPGSYVMLPRVAGHRDADTTDCPGSAFYYRLPSIRPRITQLEGDPAVLRMVASSVKVAPGTQVTLSGTLTTMSAGAPIAAAPLSLQTLANDQATTIATVTTGPDGSWRATVPVTLNTVLRTLHGVAPAAASNVIEVGVVLQVTLMLASGPGAPVRVSGTVAPARRRLTLDIYRLAGGKRHLVASQQVTARAGRFSIAPRLPRKRGSYLLIARAPANDQTLAGASPPLAISV